MTGRGRTRLRRLSSAAARRSVSGFFHGDGGLREKRRKRPHIQFIKSIRFTSARPSSARLPPPRPSVHPSIHPSEARPTQDRLPSLPPVPSRRARPFLRPSSGRESLSRFASLPPSDLSRIREEGTIVHGRDKGAWVVRAQLRMRGYRSNRRGSVSLSHVSCGSRSIARMIWRSCATTLEISARKPLRRR